jgi:hypothetical protein
MSLQLCTRRYEDTDETGDQITVGTSGNDVSIEVNGEVIYLPIDLARKVARNIETGVGVILTSHGLVRS